MFCHRYSIKNSFTVNSSLFVCQCGYENCRPHHSYGPIARDHNLLHFVFSGKGVLEFGGERYEIHAGQGFLIPTGMQSKYTADGEDPWFYGWMGFDGENSNQSLALCGISNNKVIFEFKNIEKVQRCIESLTNSYGHTGNSFTTISKMFEIFSYINPDYDSFAPQWEILNDVITYIEKSYAQNITVEQISKTFNISRSQLFRLFKNKLDISPQQYIKYYRINHAADLLRRTNKPINEIMLESGFDNRCNFSRQFKSIYGRSPSEYRKYTSMHTSFWDFEHSPSGIG